MGLALFTNVHYTLLDKRRTRRSSAGFSVEKMKQGGYMETSEVARHTPGPWEVNVAPRGKDVPQVSVSGETAVCILSENGDEEANARLIAAAPDLLTALQAV